MAGRTNETFELDREKYDNAHIDEDFKAFEPVDAEKPKSVLPTSFFAV
jgi:hypothetical protein